MQIQLMEIFSLPFDSEDFYTRPDTSLCKEPEVEENHYRYYVPDGVASLKVIPLVYIKIERPCKSVLAEFAPRHYKLCGYGIHLVCDYLPEGKSLDNSTFLSIPTETAGLEQFNEAVERVNRYMSLRTGDLLTLELPEVQELTITDNNTCKVCYKDIAVTVIS